MLGGWNCPSARGLGNPRYSRLGSLRYHRVACCSHSSFEVRGQPLADGLSDRPHSDRRAINLVRLAMWLRVSLAALAVCLCLTGCSFLKPAHETTQRFVLTPLPATGSGAVASGALAVGVGQVKIPGYLFDTSLAVRNGTNEIKYLPTTLWAERLDTGVQRILAANLATLLPTDQIRFSTWRREDVAAEVYLNIQQFDVDASGRGVLVAWWRILSPGGDKTLKAGESRFSQQGPVPADNPSGAVATLSDLLGELSRQLAQTLKETRR